MSRNVDKANSVLVRYQELQAEQAGGYKDYSRFKRPTKVNKVTKLDEAQRWRAEVVKDIGNKITQIHDPSLNDLQIEELNDELNRLFYEKLRWETHIRKVLKGPDYRKMKKGLNTTGGRILNGTRYFGRALELPAVQELIKQEKEQKRKQLTKAQKHQQLIANVNRWKKELGTNYYGEDITDDILNYEESRGQDLKLDIASAPSDDVPKVIIPQFEDLPTMADVERWLVEKRKKRLQKQLGL
ncbi:HEL110Wp [Eremothecium sinecaudum]|uniref:Pre-mRNA-splicing factor ISY1 n=1 Tax=Eremothecium sinecaudum TaxID=45286 RepID=A0A0X8HTJ4_9SACH|nr:HEL110Wp [Eremothecium sinecaudum]AMD21170.1 HEL110Wp [Eremothecium sinecaudum]